MARKRIIVELTEAEAKELRAIVGNGWGDGDFAGWGGAHAPTQKRAIQKLDDAIRQGPVYRVDRKILALVREAWNGVQRHAAGDHDYETTDAAELALAKLVDELR